MPVTSCPTGKLGNGKSNPATACVISRFDDAAAQCTLVSRVVTEGLTRDETLAAIRAAERAGWEISVLTRVASPAPMRRRRVDP